MIYEIYIPFVVLFGIGIPCHEVDVCNYYEKVKKSSAEPRKIERVKNE
jgi:hypothetical protein